MTGHDQVIVAVIEDCSGENFLLNLLFSKAIFVERQMS